MKDVILTGLRANNDLHIGNYFGALLPVIDMATSKSTEYEVHLFVPDLHSFTTPIQHGHLQEQIWHNLRLFVAAGLPLDNAAVHIYRQSYISAHSELTWILDCFTGMGEMSRMTQFKDKSQALSQATELQDTIHDAAQAIGVEAPTGNKNSVSVGLFNYPVLMAADILLYGARYVPVGDDQSQHLEFTRDIAERMNNRFGELFRVPEPVGRQHEFFGKDQGLRIKDLAEPTKKMSKSDATGKGVIFLGDEPAIAAKKIMSAATDSVGEIHFDWQAQPGITNLLQILALISGREQTHVNAEWEGKTSYGELKQAVAQAVADFLTQFQARLGLVDDTLLQQKLEASEATVSEIANHTLHAVQRAVGLRS